MNSFDLLLIRWSESAVQQRSLYHLRTPNAITATDDGEQDIWGLSQKRCSQCIASKSISYMKQALLW